MGEGTWMTIVITVQRAANSAARTSLRNFISVMKIISKKVLHFCLVCILIRIGLNKSIKSIYFHRIRLEMPMLTYDLDRRGKLARAA